MNGSSYRSGNRSSLFLISYQWSEELRFAVNASEGQRGGDNHLEFTRHLFVIRDTEAVRADYDISDGGRNFNLVFFYDLTVFDSRYSGSRCNQGHHVEHVPG